MQNERPLTGASQRFAIQYHLLSGNASVDIALLISSVHITIALSNEPNDL